MNRFSRRDILRKSALGLAALGAGGLTLRAGARPTEASGELGAYGKFLAARGEAPALTLPEGWVPTERGGFGPFYLQGAPFRAKVTPPLEPGKFLLIRGRVWGHDTRKPLAGAVLDVWQADEKGRYSGKEEELKNRARLVTDESCHYEFETIRPGRYGAGFGERASHIHYLVRHRGYRNLVTQLYFEGDPRNAQDPLVKKSLIIPLREIRAKDGSYEAGTFDIVLVPA